MKDDIIESARRQLAQGGYAAVNFADLAQIHGTTRANLHHHFGNKHGLAESALCAYIEEALNGARALGDECAGDFEAFVERVERLVLASALKGRRDETCPCMQLLFDDDTPQDLRARAQAFFAAKRRIMVDHIKGAQAAGSLSSHANADALAQRLAALLLGVTTALRLADKPKSAALALQGMIPAAMAAAVAATP